MTQPVELTLKGRMRRLKFTIPEVKALEARLGKTAGAIFSDLTQLGITTLQQVLWAALRHEDPRLRYEDVEGLIQDHLDTGGSTMDFLYAINEAVVASGLFGRGAKPETTTPS